MQETLDMLIIKNSKNVRAKNVAKVDAKNLFEPELSIDDNLIKVMYNFRLKKNLSLDNNRHKNFKRFRSIRGEARIKIYPQHRHQCMQKHCRIR